MALWILSETGATQGTLPPPGAAAPSATKPPAVPAQPRSPRNASYTITARLDPGSRTLKGEQLVTWRNISTVTVNNLRLHLYFNAWRNTRSTWLRESLLSGDSFDRHRSEGWGWTDVTSLKLVRASGAPIDVTARLRFVAPDDGNPDDRTLAEIPLDAAVAPGETVNLQVAWTSRIPTTFSRTGVVGTYYFVAQWFPKIAVLEDSGWSGHQFHAATEFFADFGIYDVRLTVPTGWTVGATGVERDRRDEADRTTTHHYYAEDVHDFAWTTSPDYLERTERFAHPGLPPVDLRLLLQPEHAGQADRHFQAARAALRYFGEWFGAYPYTNLTIVDPAWQSGAGGMEYPTLITAGTSWLAPRGVAEPEDVVVHETAHQFWYGVVATNETEHAWMDEGLTTYSTARALEQFFGPQYYTERYFGGFIPWVFKDLPLTRAVDGNLLAGYRAGGSRDVPATATWRYWPATAPAISYSKTSVWLHTLERLVGSETVQRILQTYYTRYAFKHPKPQDFFAVASEVSGQDLTWFFDQVYRSANTFDYKIDTFTSDMPAVEGHLEDGERPATGTYRTSVVVRREGAGAFPVDVRVMLENGQELRWRWDGRDPWRLFEADTPVRALTAEVDPERVLLLDTNYTNNSRTLSPQRGAAARRWSLSWLLWLQDHLLTYGFFL
jgi:hypothetical protein